MRFFEHLRWFKYVLECASDVHFCVKPRFALCVGHQLFKSRGMERVCNLSCSHRRDPDYWIKDAFCGVPMRFACAGSSLHGWIPFTMNASAHGVGWLYMHQVGCLHAAPSSSNYGNRQRRHAGVANSMQHLGLLPGLALVNRSKTPWCVNLLALFRWESVLRRPGLFCVAGYSFSLTRAWFAKRNPRRPIPKTMPERHPTLFKNILGDQGSQDRPKRWWMVLAVCSSDGMKFGALAGWCLFLKLAAMSGQNSSCSHGPADWRGCPGSAKEDQLRDKRQAIKLRFQSMGESARLKRMQTKTVRYEDPSGRSHCNCV